MKAIYATTDEIDVDYAIKELLDQIREQLPLQKNTVGILFYDYEMEGAELCEQLCSTLNIDIFGCSTIGTVSSEYGYQDMVASLTLLTADDCEFQIGIAQELTDKNVVNKICKSYTDIKNKTKLNPALIY